MSNEINVEPGMDREALQDVINKAIRSGGGLNIVYKDSKGEVFDRVIDPKIVKISKKGSEYMVTIDDKSQEWRSFTLDNVYLALET